MQCEPNLAEFIYLYIYIYASTAVLTRGIRTFGPGKQSATETDWLTSPFELKPLSPNILYVLEESNNNNYQKNLEFCESFILFKRILVPPHNFGRARRTGDCDVRGVSVSVLLLSFVKSCLRNLKV